MDSVASRVSALMCMTSHVCKCTVCVPGAHRDEKTSDLLVLKLQEVVSHLVIAGN